MRADGHGSGHGHGSRHSGAHGHHDDHDHDVAHESGHAHGHGERTDHGRGHAHGHGHAHGSHLSASSRALRAALVLTTGFMVVEAVSGYRTQGLALLADAAHMLADAGSLALALAA